jgi:predicted RNA-binding Zn ribbon-like protein
MGLSTLACDLGPTRLGVCDASPCRHVFVDTSPNQSRRYCSDRCSSRANVAAFRARQRRAVQAETTPDVAPEAASL